MTKSKRAISVETMYNIKFETMQFKGVFKDSFGQPQLGGTWLSFGSTSQGKTSLNMQLAKYLTNFGKVAYNSYEEGVSKSFQDAIVRNNMRDVSADFVILQGEPVEDLIKRLKRRRSPRIIFMDSIQHARLTKQQYKRLKNEFPNKLFIYTSHARGKQPKGEVADFIRYDADIKIFTEGFRAFPEGRLSGDSGQYFDIWPEKSKIYWQEL